MPFCKKCGTVYPKSMGVCPSCNAKEQLALHQAQAQGVPYESPEEERAVKKRRWIALCIAVPGLIAFLYAIGYIMKSLSQS